MNINNNRAAFFPVFLLLIAMISVQSGASLAKTLFPLVGAEGVTALRVGIGAILLMLFLRPWHYRHKWQITRQSLVDLFFYGVSLGTMNLLFYMAVERIPLGIAVALEFTGPLALATFASRRAADFIWILLAVIGLYFLLPLRDNVEGIDLAGVVYALGAGVCWAIYIIYGKRAGSVFGTPAVALGAMISSLFIVPIGLVQVGMPLVAPSILPIALGVALLSTAIPFSLEMAALTRLPTKTYGTLMSLEPAFGALCGMIFLKEMLTLNQWLALGAIIVASIGATLTIKSTVKVESV
jgi:inner membrane transporter RhtA